MSFWIYNDSTRKMIKKKYGREILAKTDIAYETISEDSSPKLIGIGGFASIWELNEYTVRKVSVFLDGSSPSYSMVEKSVKHDDDVAELIFRERCPYLVTYDKAYVRCKDISDGKVVKCVWICTLKLYESLTEQSIYLNKCIPFITLCHIIKDVCQGGFVLHEHGIVHKDIHVNNILHDANYSEGNTKGCYVLTDYGISGFLDYSSENGHPYAVTNTLVGRKSFLPPEIKKHFSIRGDFVSIAQCDIWQLGMVLKQLIPRSILSKNQKKALQCIVKKATKEKPSERYETFLQMKQAVEQIENIV